ncbi:MAG: tRNA 4-thiouridine(8) synthase ThiI [Ruminococcaceae bacterium]|nr:tRNA 4-thiouridine(8) synthase ThiI [Oscillospiraceae bacterium]
MQEIIMVKCGEIILKGLNRHVFEERLVKNIKYRLRGLGKIKVHRAQATVYIEPEDGSKTDQMIERLKRVFGIVNIAKVYRVEKDMDKICALALELMKETDAKTFKVEAKRSDKKFPLNSPQICAKVGETVFEGIEGIEVDVKHPDVVLWVEIRDTEGYVYTNKIKGAGGMPTGCNGKATLLLSGGIDSPAAGYMIGKRGVELNAVHFHSYPYTSERAKEKVIELAEIMASWCGTMELYIVPFTECQLAINQNCPSDEGTILMRRMMARITQKIAKQTDSHALVTGESVGQVASQTIYSLEVTNQGLELPVFRPLIGMDKDEIVTVARKIGTFETSILPYEDCCTVFVAKHPKTKPVLADILESEKALDYDALIDRAVEQTEVIKIAGVKSDEC